MVSCTSLYDKRDDFNFHITNFPFLSSNIPSSPAFGVFIPLLIRYAKSFSSYKCFILRTFIYALRTGKFYGRYGDLVKHYEVSLSQMLDGILGHDTLIWSDITPICELITELDLITDFDLITKFREASIEHCNGCDKPTEDAYFSGHLVLSHLGLAFVLMLRPFFPELVMSTDLLSFEYPSVLLFS